MPPYKTPLRLRIAQETARLLATHQASDFLAAKQKAARNLGARQDADLPSHREIEAAFIEYQSLFQADQYHKILHQLRQSAVNAMQFLQSFEPRLTGAVLHGSVQAHQTIELHLFTETPEAVGFLLDEHRIPFQLKEQRLPLSKANTKAAQPTGRFPCYCLLADNVPFELVVFPMDGLRQAPLNSHTQKPMLRANLKTVLALLESSAASNTNTY